MTYKASVIIPVYNSADSLERCVESIVFGEERNVEVILVEDCSKDNSWDVCCKLVQRYRNVSCYQNERNSGVSFARNKGLRESHGKYVLFVDSDDWVSGRYSKTLLQTADQFESGLVICGCHFYDNVHKTRRKYIWEEKGESYFFIKRDNYFELVKRYHLQQLWNKVFHRDIIEKNHIRFDEKQSMGEDFQFVLDYIEAAKIQQCVVINEALYYYIRANENSLMSRFGLSDGEKAVERYRSLLNISGAGDVKNICTYEALKKSLKQTSIYQIVRAKGFTKKEKLEYIEKLMGDGEARHYYTSEVIQIQKEKMFELHRIGNKIRAKVSGKVQQIINEKRIDRAKKQLIAQDFSIISQNCIGGVLYHDMGKSFISPTINLFIWEPDFVRFVNNLRLYIDSELEMSWGEEYPVGLLGGDVRIEFMHYTTCSEAKAAWDRRKKRINWDKVVIFATDRNGFDEEAFEQWKRIPYPKILFTTHKEYENEEACVFYKEYSNMPFVPDLIPKREFYSGGTAIKTINTLKDKG